MKVLVLGSGGMLGTDLVSAGEEAAHEVKGFSRGELDVTDADLLERRFARESPDAIVNCAAYTEVDAAEDDPETAIAVNAAGAGNVAAAAANRNAKVLYVSTDYVFDGTKGTAYVESDPVSPVNQYGRSKAAGEQATVSANRRSLVVRTSGLFGLNGPNFVDTMLRLGRAHGQVLVVRDQVTSPTWTWHLANGLIRLLDSSAYGVHHMTAAGECSWYEFAREIFRQSGMDVTTLSATSEMFDRKAPRPAHSVLASEERHHLELPSWQDGLAGYLAQRRAQEKDVP